MVPAHVQDKISSSVRPHLAAYSEGEKGGMSAAKDAMNDTYDVAKTKAYQMEIPPEYKDELLSRLKTSLKKFQSRTDFQDALDDIFDSIGGLVDSSKSFSKDKLEKGRLAVQETQADSEWTLAMEHARSLLENVFNGNSLQSLIEASKTFYADIINDGNLLAMFQGWKNFIQAMLRNPDYVESESFTSDARQLSDQTGKLIADKYRAHANNVFTELSSFLSGAKEDETNQEFMDSLRILWSDMFLDDEGNFTVKRELLDDLTRCNDYDSESVIIKNISLRVKRYLHAICEKAIVMKNEKSCSKRGRKPNIAHCKKGTIRTQDLFDALKGTPEYYGARRCLIIKKLSRKLNKTDDENVVKDELDDKSGDKSEDEDSINELQKELSLLDDKTKGSRTFEKERTDTMLHADEMTKQMTLEEYMEYTKNSKIKFT
ncbi:unnamed protein product, partial [Sphagnum tenellum]